MCTAILEVILKEIRNIMKNHYTFMSAFTVLHSIFHQSVKAHSGETRAGDYRAKQEEI